MNKLLLAGALGLSVGLSGLIGFTPNAVAQTTSEEPLNDPKTTFEYLDLFGDIFERVRSSYVEEVNEKELIQSAINGMLTSLDPHSSYLPPKGFEDMQVQTRGEFGGLGIEVTMESGFVKVVSPIDDTPAAKAGLQAGDFITHIDGEQILGLTLGEAVEKMRGPVGAAITITVSRASEEEPFDVTLIRDTIKIRAVRNRTEGDIGYVRVTTFNKHTFENLAESIEKVKGEIGEDKIKGWIVDLRNNPGGLLTQAIAVSDAFLDHGEIVSTRGRDESDSDRYNARDGDLTDGKPIVVLVNGGSASASEIVAGALQDHRRAIIVGTKTFGKGSVQTIMSLQGKGAIRLTTARYYTPSGRSIQALGIEPDIIVEPAKVELLAQNPNARTEANLRGSLENDSMTEEELLEREEEEKEKEAAADRREKDNQLSYALDLLHGLSIYSTLQQ